MRDLARQRYTAASLGVNPTMPYAWLHIDEEDA
jgi:hypothetical protein